MKVVIDTSSLLSLVRYYLPFDKDNKLFEFIKTQFENGSLVLVDAVLAECQFTSRKLVIEQLDYLADKNFMKQFGLPTKTKDLLPPSTRKFYNMLDNNFRTTASRRLNEAEFEQRKKEFLDSADARIIIYALNAGLNKGVGITIVTEETEAANDHKAFKKIPALCRLLDLDVMTLPQLLAKYNEINIEFR